MKTSVSSSANSDVDNEPTVETIWIAGLDASSRLQPMAGSSSNRDQVWYITSAEGVGVRPHHCRWHGVRPPRSITNHGGLVEDERSERDQLRQIIEAYRSAYALILVQIRTDVNARCQSHPLRCERVSLSAR